MAHSSHSERSIHEMLRDTPTMNESSSAIHSGTEPRIKPNSLALHNISGSFITSSFSLFFRRILWTERV